MLRLLTTGDKVPVAHQVFAGNTNDASTLPGVLHDLKRRFAISGITVVGDRGLISEANLEVVTDAGLSHVMATRLPRDRTAAAALDAAHHPEVAWVPVAAGERRGVRGHRENQRCVVVASFEQWRRDTTRAHELVAKTEAKLLALEDRVRSGVFTDPGKIGRAAQPILSASPVARVFDLENSEGRFFYHYDETSMCLPPSAAAHTSV